MEEVERIERKMKGSFGSRDDFLELPLCRFNMSLNLFLFVF